MMPSIRGAIHKESHSGRQFVCVMEATDEQAICLIPPAEGRTGFRGGTLRVLGVCNSRRLPLTGVA
jgi:hypothetical protein